MVAGRGSKDGTCKIVFIIGLLVCVCAVTARAQTIHEAAAAGNIVALSAALETNANLEARDEPGLTPLHLAVQNGHLAAAALLVDKGADVNSRDPDGNTLLQRLIQHSGGFTVHDPPPANWRGRLGFAPLADIYSTYFSIGQDGNEHRAIALATSFLLISGADAKATNTAGRTAFSLATDQSINLGDDREPLLQLLRLACDKFGSVDADGNTQLHLGFLDISVDQMARLIAGGADINTTNRQGRTPLHKIVEKIYGWDLLENGTNEPFQFIMSLKPNVNAQDNDGLTPLHVLAMSDTSFKRQAFALLFAAGANPNLADHHGRTPAHLVLTGKWPWREANDAIGLLVNAGANLSAKDDQGRTPLHYFAGLGDQHPMFFLSGIAQTFTAARVDVMARDNQGDTPLHVAARTGTRDVLDWLVQAGADMGATNSAGETPRSLRSSNSMTWSFQLEKDLMEFFWAIRTGNYEQTKKMLADNPGLLNATNHSGECALQVAAGVHRTNLIEFLEQNGARWNPQAAVEAGRTNILPEFLKQPGVITYRDMNGGNLLHIAVDSSEPPVIEMLLAAKVGLQAQDRWGLTPLGRALQNHRTNVADLLRRRGAKENIFDAVFNLDYKTAAAMISRDRALIAATNPAGSTMMEIAASTGQIDLLKLLLSKGALPDTPNPIDGKTPIFFAVVRDRPDAVAFLIRNRARVDTFDRSGRAPMHWAASQVSGEALTILLMNKADPNATMHSPASSGPRMMGIPSLAGSTPLHFAALNGRTNTVQILLQAGAFLNVTNSAGMTPLDMTSETIPVPEVFGSEYGWGRFLEPPKAANAAPTNPPVFIMDRRKAVAAILEAAGAKRSRSPMRPFDMR